MRGHKRAVHLSRKGQGRKVYGAGLRWGMPPLCFRSSYLDVVRRKRLGPERMCEDALALYRELKSGGIQTQKRPLVGNRLWVVSLTDPDGYRIDFESPTDAPEESELEE